MDWPPPLSLLDRMNLCLRDFLQISRQAGIIHGWWNRKNLPACLTITCEDDNGLIMGISHKQYDVRGLQFHPESVLTEHGYDIMRNWIEI